MAAPDPGVLQPAPTVAGWRARLAQAGAFDLASFSDAELAAVGADSPVLGLVTSIPRLAAGDGGTDEAEALVETLIAQGFVSPVPGEPAGSLRLGGDLGGIMAVRRQPALIATVAASQAAVDRPWNAPARDALLAILHGVAADGVGLFALLEETVSPPPERTHHFALATPAAQAERIRDAYRDLSATEALAVSVHVYVPDPGGPRHFQVVLTGEEARLSNDGVAWEQHTAVEDFTALFEAATAL